PPIKQHYGLNVQIILMEELSGEAEEATHHPHTQVDFTGPGWSSPLEPVHTDQREEQDAAVVVPPNDNVHQLKHRLAEQPVELLHHEEVCSGQVTQIDVCHGGVSTLEAEHTQDEGVTQHAQQADDGHVGWLHAVHPLTGLCDYTPSWQ
uniref:Uncharacterized protein n=1 Tax=Oncorhynchus kisutch TaxID=8019 RepID=A0A8C7MIP1_ONCKI